ncbi:MAG: hypothetical protein KA200_00450 [Burkholderiales bacterium]|nr:hypothetical protein [Burkholderiales bacterium]
MTDDTAARLRALAQAERNALNALSDADPPVPLELRMAYDTAFDALLEAIDGETLLALLDALDEARAERDAAMALLRECDEVAVSLCGVADLVEHGDLFARIDAILGGDKGA